MAFPRILASSKYQAAAVATALIAVPLIFNLTDKNVGRAEKQSATEKFIIAAAGLWGIAVGGTALEDYGAKRDAPAGTGTPAVQVNTNSDVANTQAAPPAPAGLSPISLPPNPPTWTSSNAPPPAGFQRTSTETP